MAFANSVGLVAFTLALAASPPASAEPILPGPNEDGYDAALGALASAYQRQLDVFSARESGLPLDALIDPAAVQQVRDFFAQSATNDFQKFAGRDAFTVVTRYEEYEDMGNFAGVASAGIAARLIALRAEHAPAAEIDAARAAAVRAARTWHVYGAIAGPGIIARGVRRRVPEQMGAILPGMPESTQLTPLADGSGAALPAVKAPVWRAPVAPGFDDWIWLDDTSKDQVSGYVLGAAWLWDALHDDEAAPPEVSQAIAGDLAGLARALMRVDPDKGIDLCLRDADGRLPGAYDLNPRIVTPDGLPLPEDSSLANGFNAAMALGVIRAAYHVSGDDAIGRYYYGELVRRRDLPGEMARDAGFLYLGTLTNYSNVNMLAISLALIGRFESDPGVRDDLEQALQNQFWDAGDSRDASHVEQAWFDAVYGAYAANVAEPIGARIDGQLSAFNPPPAFARDRVNCDDAAIQKGVCLGIDGKTVIKLEPDKGHGGMLEAVDILPMSIRPDSDFEWRSDPHRVNGTGGTLMAPGGDFIAAYWFARAAQLGGREANESPAARPPLAPSADASEPGPGGGASASCSFEPARPEPSGLRQAAIIGLAALIALARQLRRG